jgi:hypothetical protein
MRMYAVAECTMLFGLTVLVGSLLLGASVVLLMVHEGVTAVWRMSRKIASNRRHRVAARELVGPQSLARAPMVWFVAAKRTDMVSAKS